MFIWNSCPDLTDDDAVTVFIDQVNELKPGFEKRGAPLRMIFMDTLSKALRTGNVSDFDTAGRAINSLQRIIDETGCSVAPSAHTAKAEGSDTIKGAGEFGDSADAYIYVEKDKDTGVVTATLGKQSDGPDGLQFAVMFEEVVVGEGRHGPIKSGAVTPVDLPEKAGTKVQKRLEARLELVMRCFQQCVEAGQFENVPPINGVRSGTKGVRRDVLRQKMTDEGFTAGSEDPDSVRKAMNRSIDKLIEIQRLRGNPQIVWEVG